MLKNLPTKYDADIDSWITSREFEGYILPLDMNVGAKN
jgi:hypothetical protein